MAFPVISEAFGYFDAVSFSYGADFLAFYTGGLLLNKGKASELYDEVAQKGEQTRLGAPKGVWLPYFYPPAYAWLMRPWSTLPYPIAFRLWQMTCIVCHVFSLWLICRGLRLQLTPDILLVGTAYPPVYFNVFVGQNGAWFLLVYALAFYLMTKERDFLAGLILGLGVLKPQLFWLIPLMIIAQRRWKLLAGSVVMSMGLAFSSLLIVGVQGIRDYLALFNTPFYTIPSSRFMFMMQSLPQFLGVILGGRVGQFALAGLVSIPITMLSWRALARDRSPEALFLISVMGAILGAPQAFHYDLVLLILPALILYPRLSKMNGSRQVQVALAALFLTALLMWIWLPLQPSVLALLTLYILVLRETRSLVPGMAAPEEAPAPVSKR